MKLKVAIVFGGKSAEHEISLLSATNIFNAVDRTKFIPLLLGVDKRGIWCYNSDYPESGVDLTEQDYFVGATRIYMLPSSECVEIIRVEGNTVLENVDVVLPIIHGTYGEDGTLQGFLKSMGIPFVGADVLASAIAMDKEITKRLLRDAGIPIANFYTLLKHAPLEHTFEEIVATLGLPLFVKPANAGSSIGVSKVSGRQEFERAIATAFQFDNKILVEEAIVGKEIECAVLGNEDIRASVVGEIVPAIDFYSYDTKYVHTDGAKLKIPARIDPTVSERIRENAIKAFQTIGCEGLARVDFFLRENNSFVLNEINTLPGFTEISMYPKLWEYMGLSVTDLLTVLISLALQRYKRNSKLLTEGR